MKSQLQDAYIRHRCLINEFVNSHCTAVVAFCFLIRHIYLVEVGHTNCRILKSVSFSKLQEMKSITV